jgi:kinesin family protein 5
MKKTNIKVVCRIRPENDLEISQKGLEIIKTNEEYNTVIFNDLNIKDSFSKNERFNFDNVFYKNYSTQEDIFDVVAKPALESTFNGFNGTILCYGQTSSGKTFTMEGNGSCNINKGIIPRSMEYIFDYINGASDTNEFSIKCSYLEIYNEKIYDLLRW